MSKLKKLAVCLTALIIIFSFSVLTVSASEIPFENVNIGELPQNYDYVDFDVVQASWYCNGSYIGDSAIEIVSTGGYRFKDTLYQYTNGELVELRIYIKMPLEYVNKYYNYFFQINSFESRLKPYKSTASLIKYNYQADNQTNYHLNWYDNNVDSGFQVENTSIYLTKDIICLNLFYNAYGNSSNPAVQEAFKPIEILIGGAYYSRSNPGNPAYTKPNTDKFDKLEDLENQLTEDSQQHSNDEINKVNDSLLGSLQRYTSGFSAVGALFLNLALKVVDIQALVYISLAIGVVPLIVGLTVNGLRASDKKSNYKGRDD